MSVAKSFVFETEVPDYQREAVEWLRGYRGTRRIRELLLKVKFSEQEIEIYRHRWEKWLKPKTSTLEKLHRGIH